MEELNEALGTWRYAITNNINPLDPTTWDREYKERQQRLAGISPNAEKQVALFKEWLDSIPKSVENQHGK